MLVLTRRPNETLTIGDNITIKILEIRGGQVRIGVTAPSNVTIQRDEIADKPRQAQPPGSGP